MVGECLPWAGVVSCTIEGNRLSEQPGAAVSLHVLCLSSCIEFLPWLVSVMAYDQRAMLKRTHLPLSSFCSCCFVTTMEMVKTVVKESNCQVLSPVFKPPWAIRCPFPQGYAQNTFKAKD